MNVGGVHMYLKKENVWKRKFHLIVEEFHFVVKIGRDYMCKNVELDLVNRPLSSINHIRVA